MISHSTGYSSTPTPVKHSATNASRTITGSIARYWPMPPATPAITLSVRLRISRWVGLYMRIAPSSLAALLPCIFIPASVTIPCYTLLRRSGILILRPRNDAEVVIACGSLSLMLVLSLTTLQPRQHGSLSFLQIIFCPYGAKNDLQRIENARRAKVLYVWNESHCLHSHYGTMLGMTSKPHEHTDQAALIESWRPYFSAEYARDQRNAQRQTFDEYWRW